MKNIQAQYQDLLEGKMSKSNFMRNVRMQFPQHISPVTSYDDSVKILKGKRILSETKIEELSPQTRYNAMMKADTIYRDQEKKRQQDPENYSQSKSDDARYKSLEFEKHISPTTRKRVEDFAKKLNLRVEIKKVSIADDNYKPRITLSFLPYSGQGELVKVHITKTSDTIEGVLPGGEESRKALKNIIAQIKEEELNVEPSETRLNEAKKPEGVYGHNPNAEMDEYRGIDHLNYYQVYKGLQFELAKMPEITDENYIKARKKVVDTIMKDPDAYKDLQLANFKAVKEMDKDLEMKDVKKNNLTDKSNEMKVVKKDEKGNTQDTLEKKEKKKSKTAKIPVMTQTPKGKLEAMETPGKEKVMALKEHILDELTKPNEVREDINKGSRVKKKGLEGYDAAQVGNVIEFDGDTATVQWDNDKVEHVQANILTKKDIPQHPKAAEKFGQIPDSPFMKKEEKSEENKKKGLKDKLMKVVKELLFRDKKTGKVQSFQATDPAMKDPQFNQVFQKA